MKTLLFVFLTSSFSLYAQTTRTTCMTNAEQKEECIKSECDQKGVCIDKYLNKQTNKTTPIEISPEAIHFALLNIRTLDKSLLKLSDDSLWTVEQDDVTKAQQWMASKPVSVYLTHPVTNEDVRYHLTNINNNEAITIRYDSASFTGEESEISRTVTSVDKDSSLICLSDGTCCEYDPMFAPQPIENVVIVGNPVLLGANATFFKESFPNILIVLQQIIPPRIIAIRNASPKDSK